MYISALIISFGFALLFALLLTYGFRRKGPGPADGLVFFLLIIFMFSWAIGGWIAPFGPVYWGIPWMGYLFLAFSVTLLLGMLLPPSKPPYKTNEKPATDYDLFEKNAAKYPIGITFGIFFWVTMIVLLAMGIIKIAYYL
ncbi:MAG: hypothetical protein KJ578_00305 [Bacteroidetes bacterium]|nr:hypothetical protein [Bacteroidota bacterium]MBU1580366.1 hypothetical protein [Bacteroidota bacterium]MBU2556201.1 hypothetical protein [Bacteroidota bacterium]